MKKNIVTLFILLLSMSVNAQNTNPNKKKLSSPYTNLTQPETIVVINGKIFNAEDKEVKKILSSGIDQKNGDTVVIINDVKSKSKVKHILIITKTNVQ